MERIAGQKTDGFHHCEHGTPEIFYELRDQARANGLAKHAIGSNSQNDSHVDTAAELSSCWRGEQRQRFSVR